MEKNFTGIIIEESLEKKDVLKELIITKTKIEKATSKHKTPWVKQWTLHSIEILESKAEEIAKELSKSLDSKHNWYADFKNNNYHYIIFYKKVFKIDRSKPEQYYKVTEYGISLGIPDYQLNFSHHIKEWKRNS